MRGFFVGAALTIGMFSLGIAGIMFSLSASSPTYAKAIDSSKAYVASAMTAVSSIFEPW